MDYTRLDLVLQYALAVSDRDLSATHLLKYAYLADVAHAQAHAGATFTGIPWVFLHFGPYSKEAQQHVPEAATKMGAEVRQKERLQDGTAYVSYHGGNEELAERLRDQLPPEVASAVRWSVREHGADTPALLDAVYRTEPMLRAAPGETLDFRPEPQAQEQGGDEPPPAPAEGPKAAWKIRKEQKGAREKIAAEAKRRLAEATGPRRRGTGPSPRYDETFRAGMKALDELAGDPVPQGRADASFPASIWKSPSRRDPHGT
jgi:hypothetical protein